MQLTDCYLKEGENKYIAACLEEIKQELRQYNLSVKANAVAKLNYLQMLGYDISWAGFNVIEVSQSSGMQYSRIFIHSNICQLQREIKTEIVLFLEIVLSL